MVDLTDILLVAIITAIIGPLINTWYQSYLKKKQKKVDPVVNSIKSNSKVDERLEQIQEEYKADRVWISQFHNGDNFYPTGKSVTKFSVMFEHTTLDTESRMNTFTGIPASLFSKPLMELYENEKILIPNYKLKNARTYGLRTFAEALNAKSTYIFALKSLEGDFIGTMGVEYTKKNKKLTEEQINDLSNSAVSLGTLIGEYLADIKEV